MNKHTTLGVLMMNCFLNTSIVWGFLANTPMNRWTDGQTLFAVVRKIISRLWFTTDNKMLKHFLCKISLVCSLNWTFSDILKSKISQKHLSKMDLSSLDHITYIAETDKVNFDKSTFIDITIQIFEYLSKNFHFSSPLS